jgi:carboxylesterase type B
LPYVFHSAENRGYKFTINEDQLSNLMVGYWTNFAKELNPSHSGNNWPQFEPDALNLIFVTPLRAISAKSDLGANCEFWDSIGYELHQSWWGLF